MAANLPADPTGDIKTAATNTGDYAGGLLRVIDDEEGMPEEIVDFPAFVQMGGRSVDMERVSSSGRLYQAHMEYDCFIIRDSLDTSGYLTLIDNFMTELLNVSEYYELNDLRWLRIYIGNDDLMAALVTVGVPQTLDFN